MTKCNKGIHHKGSELEESSTLLVVNGSYTLAIACSIYYYLKTVQSEADAIWATDAWGTNDSLWPTGLCRRDLEGGLDKNLIIRRDKVMIY